MLRTSLLVILRVEWIDFDTMFGGEHQFEGLHKIGNVGASGFRSPISMAGDFEESLATLTPKQPALPPPGAAGRSSDCTFPDSAPRRTLMAQVLADAPDKSPSH